MEILNHYIEDWENSNLNTENPNAITMFTCDPFTHSSSLFLMQGDQRINLNMLCDEK